MDDQGNGVGQRTVEEEVGGRDKSKDSTQKETRKEVRKSIRKSYNP
jgi:hypothetical protein